MKNLVCLALLLAFVSDANAGCRGGRRHGGGSQQFGYGGGYGCQGGSSSYGYPATYGGGYAYYPATPVNNFYVQAQPMPNVPNTTATAPVPVVSAPTPIYAATPYMNGGGCANGSCSSGPAFSNGLGFFNGSGFNGPVRRFFGGGGGCAGCR